MGVDQKSKQQGDIPLAKKASKSCWGSWEVIQLESTKKSQQQGASDIPLGKKASEKVAAKLFSENQLKKASNRVPGTFH